jgi:hypothetical protein
LQSVIPLSQKRNLNSSQLWILYQNSWKRFQKIPTEANEEAALQLSEQWRAAYLAELQQERGHA